MSQSYPYAKAINIGRIEQEIKDSAIVTAFEAASSTPVSSSIVFKAALSTGDKTVLDQIVTDHVNEPLPDIDNPVDSDGSIIVRAKAAKKGRTYHQHYIQFKTAEQNSLVENNQSGQDLGYATLSFLKWDEATSAFISCTEDMAEFTILEFAPDFSYEVIGGEVRLTMTPNDDTYLWVIGVPDVPAPHGSKSMIENCNLKFYGPGDPIVAQGKVSKEMPYSVAGLSDGVANKLKFYIKHHKAINLEIQVYIEMFKD